jgi:hypothetical protein
MKNERIPVPCINIMAVSKELGLMPTSAYVREARCYVHLAPLLWCSLNDVGELTHILQNRASEPVTEVAMTFDEAKRRTDVSSVLKGAKTVSVGIVVLPDTYNLRILRNNSKGEWLGEPCALETDFLSEEGFESVARAIIDHLKSRKDLPDKCSLSAP